MKEVESVVTEEKKIITCTDAALLAGSQQQQPKAREFGRWRIGCGALGGWTDGLGQNYGRLVLSSPLRRDMKGEPRWAAT